MSSLKQRWSALLCATLETWCHELLYVRQVYPRDTFTKTRFLGGISCQANRHPGVVRYISETLQVAVPALLSGSVNEVSLVVMKDSFTVAETYTLTFSGLLAVGPIENEEQSKGVLEHLERGMRDLILSVLSLEGTPHHQRLGDDASFKLTMRTTNVDSYCPELTKVMEDGSWYRPNVPGSGQGTAEEIRSLHQVSLPVGNLNMNVTINKQTKP